MNVGDVKSGVFGNVAKFLTINKSDHYTVHVAIRRANFRSSQKALLNSEYLKTQAGIGYSDIYYCIGWEWVGRTGRPTHSGELRNRQGRPTSQGGRLQRRGHQLADPNVPVPDPACPAR